MKPIPTLLVVVLVFAVVSALVTPPDLISQITVMLEMAAVFGLPLLIVSRFKSYSQTPEQMKMVIVALVCLLSIAITCATLFFTACRNARMEYHELLYEQSQHADSKAPPQRAE